MSWIKIVIWVLTHARDLIAIVSTITALINSLPKAQQTAAREEIGNAIHIGDKEEVKSVLERWRDKCHGVACVTETKPL